MDNFSDIVNNHVLVVALIACLTAQFLKALIEFVRHRKLNFKVLVETGGMPSAHSALVTASGLWHWPNPGLVEPCFCCHISLCDYCDVRRCRGATGGR
jgi:acid phosphatase family membrane protein YuiD